ncbi:MAG: NAD-dependent epimerase/dehydratase family protein [Blautia sp.]|nr:NAD-dependent epimerase/dehydratase family protein [Blautia sp.]
MNRILEEDARNVVNQDIPWEKLKNKTVMVTGASGMIGSYLVRTLVMLNEMKHMNVHVIGVVRNAKKVEKEIAEASCVEIICHDVTQPMKLEQDVHYIIHAASPASPVIMKDDPVGTVAANTLGAFYTLSLAREKNAEGYMFVSSREIYGQPGPDQEMFTEDTYGFVDPLDPRSCYPEGKKAAETMCASFRAQYGLRAMAARPAHTYGPGMSIYDGRVQADFLKNIIFNENIVMKSEGAAVRTYTYISDVVSGMFHALLKGNELAYNMADERAKVSIRELAELLIRITPERKLKLELQIPEGGTKGCAPFTLGILDSSRLRGLGWAPQYTIEEGFRRMIDYLEIEKEAGRLR